AWSSRAASDHPRELHPRVKSSSTTAPGVLLSAHISDCLIGGAVNTCQDSRVTASNSAHAQHIGLVRITFDQEAIAGPSSHLAQYRVGQGDLILWPHAYFRDHSHWPTVYGQ